MTKRDELRQAAERLIKTIDANLGKWRSWFPSERSEVEVPRAELLALKHFAEIGLAAHQSDDRNSPCAWCSEPKDAHAESGLCRGTTSQYFTRKIQHQPDDDGPIDEEWLRSIGFTSGNARTTFALNDVVVWRPCNQWHVVAFGGPFRNGVPLTSRTQLRNLLEALGATR